VVALGAIILTIAITQASLQELPAVDSESDSSLKSPNDSEPDAVEFEFSTTGSKKGPGTGAASDSLTNLSHTLAHRRRCQCQLEPP
jgi:hypothetical protein